jgi:hypothetical protein
VVVVRGRADDLRGAVTAELAMALPVLVAVTWGLVWLLSVGLAQVRTVDAAREAARAMARGDAEGAAVARAREVAPADASITVRILGDEVVTVVDAAVAGPGGLFRWQPAVTVRARAVAALEASP